MKSSLVALGNFDGLHKGHMKVLQSALSLTGGGAEPFVLLFDCHPQKLIFGSEPPMIMTDSDRRRMLEDMGFQIVTVSFESVRDMSAEEFVSEILYKQLNVSSVCCGYNYRFGKDGAGDSDTLRCLCAEYNINVVVSDEESDDGEPVSSTKIRALLQDGEARTAARLMERPFSYTAEVIKGNQNGRLLGFPTANQKLPDGLVVPKYGVYESRTTVGDVLYRSITNIGVRPTITDNVLLSETHIIGFKGDIYGESIKVELLSFIREEKRFNSLEEVFDQVKKDIAAIQA